MKPILKFPRTILLPFLIIFAVVEAQVQVPFSPDYDPSLLAEDFAYWNGAASEEDVEVLAPQTPRGGRAMYLAQGVEFVFPIGVQYTLANANEQLWPLGTTGFDSVLEFPKNKIAIMFSSMINTLKIANFTVSSKIYTGETVSPTTALRILGTDLKPADFRNNYKETWAAMNKDVSTATGGAIPEFIPRGGLYGRSIYPFTTATYLNTIHYENQWAFPWRVGAIDRFTDSPLVRFLEVEGLMPYYENEAFIAVAALFKSGTGSVVFLKPKGNVSILQLMLNPTALTQIFDENFPGWGVKQMRVRVPEASFTTNSQHHDMLVKRGVSNAFCVQDTPPAKEGEDNRYSLNPIVQTNHIRIARDTFSIASVTGVTLNNEKDLKQWNARQRDDMAPETLLEEYTTPKEGLDDDVELDSTTVTAQDDVIVSDEVTTGSPSELSDDERADLASIGVNNSESTTSSSSTTASTSAEISKGEKKAIGTVETFQPQMDTYEFNEPFLWFLHAINEEPMFMGVVESFKRYLEETGNKDNIVGGPTNTPSERGVIEKNSWIYEAAKGVLWHCPSQINKQAAEDEE